MITAWLVFGLGALSARTGPQGPQGYNTTIFAYGQNISATWVQASVGNFANLVNSVLQTGTMTFTDSTGVVSRVTDLVVYNSIQTRLINATTVTAYSGTFIAGVTAVTGDFTTVDADTVTTTTVDADTVTTTTVDADTVLSTFVNVSNTLTTSKFVAYSETIQYETVGTLTGTNITTVTLNVTGNGMVEGDLHVYGSEHINTNLQVDGNAKVNGIVTTPFVNAVTLNSTTLSSASGTITDLTTQEFVAVNSTLQTIHVFGYAELDAGARTTTLNAITSVITPLLQATVTDITTANIINDNVTQLTAVNATFQQLQVSGNSNLYGGVTTSTFTAQTSVITPQVNTGGLVATSANIAKGDIPTLAAGNITTGSINANTGVITNLNTSTINNNAFPTDVPPNSVLGVTATANSITVIPLTGSQFVAASLGVIAARSFSIVSRTFTTTSTYTPTTGLQYAIVRIIGGGGGGAASTAPTGSSPVLLSCGGGGGAGEYAEQVFSASTIGASQSITIGALGAGGVAGANAGGTGGTTSFGVLLTAVGGTGGANKPTGAAISVANGGFGGTGGTGAVTYRTSGANGVTTICFDLNSPSPTLYGSIGPGGNSQLGAGGSVFATVAAAGGFGAGGGGSVGFSIAQAGQNGTPGVVLVDEYVIA